jgi:hypothetical protein
LSSPILIVCCADAGIVADQDSAPARIAMAQARKIEHLCKSSTAPCVNRIRSEEQLRKVPSGCNESSFGIFRLL